MQENPPKEAAGPSQERTSAGTLSPPPLPWLTDVLIPLLPTCSVLLLPTPPTVTPLASIATLVWTPPGMSGTVLQCGELTPVLIQSQSYTFVQFVQRPGTVWGDLSPSPSLRLQAPGGRGGASWSLLCPTAPLTGTQRALED